MAAPRFHQLTIGDIREGIRHTAATARNCGGPSPSHSPASLSTRLPPMENPASAKRDFQEKAMSVEDRIAISDLFVRYATAR